MTLWSHAALDTFQACSSAKAFPPSVRLIEQDSAVGAVYLIESGIVKLIRYEETAGREPVVALRYSGWLLGAASVILGDRSPVTAETLTPCRIRELNSARFREEMSTNRALSWQIHALHSRWLHDQFQQLAALKACSARRRLERLLWELCRMQVDRTLEGPIRLRPQLKHSEIAEAIMISAQYLSRLLGELESEGLLRRDKGWLVVLDPEKLAPRPS